MPRASNIEETLIEINKKNSQVGTRYRESGLVLGHLAVLYPPILKVSFLVSGRSKFLFLFLLPAQGV